MPFVAALWDAPHMTVAEARAEFNLHAAPLLANQVGVTPPWKSSGTQRFSCFEDEKGFLVVAGSQEGSEVDLAFALGLSYRGQRQLLLALPKEHAFATLQRAPWFNAEARPKIYLHDGVTAEAASMPNQSATRDRVGAVKPGKSPADELRDAATPKHLGNGSDGVYALVEWATTHPLLDAGHRRGERAWQTMGQKVLSMKAVTGGVAVTAGIHYTKLDEVPEPTKVIHGGHLSSRQLATIQKQVEAGIDARLAGPPPIHRPDEHWLQAVIRQDPSLVGVEQPALREVPAWRPDGDGDSKSWGRGYIDLLGVDGHGDIRIVETKLADNADDLLVFQGLDYYIWALAYRDVIVERLGAPKRSALEIHYVIGDSTDGKIHMSKHVGAQVRSLDPSIRWRFQTIHNWYGDPRTPARTTSKLHGTGELP
jgi:hypothetical protein